jgi:hypothetical protein
MCDMMYFAIENLLTFWFVAAWNFSDSATHVFKIYWQFPFWLVRIFIFIAMSILSLQNLLDLYSETSLKTRNKIPIFTYFNIRYMCEVSLQKGLLSEILMCDHMKSS